MDNQHRLIKGYRELSAEEIALMNDAKDIAQHVGVFVDSLATRQAVDARWLAIARTQLQQGFMALTRSIAKPEFF